MARLPLYLNTRTFTSHLCEWSNRPYLPAKSRDSRTDTNANANANTDTDTDTNSNSNTDTTVDL
jgi:hypothetical protein